MIKAIFFDIDGTLLSFNTHEIAKSTLDALHELRKKGIKLFVATGRHKTELDKVDEHFKFDAYVTLNGQFCYDDKDVIYENSIDIEDLKCVINHTKNDLYPCYFVGKDDIFLNKVDEDVISVCNLVNLDIPEVGDPSKALEEKIYQLVVFLSREREGLLFDNTSNLDGTRWHDSFMDVTPKGGSKRVGINALLSHYCISDEEVMAFGDGENDIEMLKYVGIGVAMGNASDDVKDVSDYVTNHIDEEGIPTALKHFGLI